MKVAFVTTNRHKFEEASSILAGGPVELEHVNMEYKENHDAGLEKIAAGAAEELSVSLNRPVIVEDTGLYFEAYPNFPGARPKFVFNSLGYQGILKLLAGEPRGARFKTVAAFCRPGEKPQLFTGSMRGNITEKVFDQDKDAMPYDRIFIPERKDKTISAMSQEEKNSLSQRGEAFRQVGKHVSEL